LCVRRCFFRPVNAAVRLPHLIKTILEQMDKRFEELTRRIDRFMVWSFTMTLTVGGLVIAALKL